MKKSTIEKYRDSFENAAFEQDGIEFWSARDMMKLLEYNKWENFSIVIDKSKLSCKNNGMDTGDHFPAVRRMVAIGSGAQREIEDILLTRYACYLIAQNADPRKQIVKLDSRKVVLTTTMVTP